MRKVFGIGVNDNTAPVNYIQDGKYMRCPYYSSWKSMLMRCYCEAYVAKQPTYSRCTVSSDWLAFSTYREWMSNQEGRERQLDKDLILKGNTVYSKNTCLFLPQHINNFFEMGKNDSSFNLLGVRYDSARGLYVSGARNALGKDIRNPRRESAFESHMDYLKAKIKVGNIYISACKDSRINHFFKLRLNEMQECLDHQQEYML